ncbi:protein lev-9 [Trichonephila inaurata madagascariensis]|uniref:Protein lev-9 n=1 Tax=Trichonephila inaurata madagascariensis TaxID=2747483 RepID=A0A8X6XBG4_9ARAC|nr:protein lev-9 [Trichonephila inaurata madagascariensis]
MRLLLITVTLSIILHGFVVRSDAEEDDYGYNFPDNPDEDENAESNSTVIEEPDLEGNDSVKDVVVVANTTVRTVLESTSEAEKKNDATLGPNECEDPPSIENAVITSEIQASYEVGAKVSYKCEFGYITDGAVPSSHCIRSETTQAPYWTKPELSCVPRSCGDPGFVDNAQRVGSVFTFPNKVTYECDEGYKLKGYESRYCHASGRWSGMLPTCERVYCDPPSHPDNGRVIYSSLVFESELRYECNSGYILRNFNGRSCIGNGTWSGEEPVCQDTQCAPPVAPEFGSVQVVGGKTRVGTRVIYTCDHGRTLKGSATSKCLDTGEWTFPTPKCLDPCSVPQVNHGKIGKYMGYPKRFHEIGIGTKVVEKEELSLRCDNKYEVAETSKKEEKIFCSGGEWASIPQCNPAQCRQTPPPTANANIGSINRTHGGGVVYLCKTFYKKVKYGSVLCDFGTWKGETPVCKDSRCSRDDISFSGLVQPRKRYFQPNERLNPSCQYGYYLTKDNNILTCVNGTWTGHFPPCTPAPCKLENLYQQEGMSPDNEGVVLNGISAQVECKKGFTRSEYQAVCSRGEWAVSGKLCKESSCIILQISNGAFTKAVEKKKWTFLSYDRWTEYEKISLGRAINPGSSVHVSCDAGYSFQGKGRNDVSVKCSFGEWDKDPVCLVTGAPYNKKAETTSDKSLAQTTTLTSTRIPFTIPNGSKVENGNAVKFFCQLFGYLRLQGPAEILCQECHWQTSKFPECAPPKTGETTVLINGDWKLLPEGTVAIQKGKTVSIQCDAKGVELIPQWIIPEASNINVESYQDYYTGRNVSVLYIWKTDIEHTGKYQCFVPGYVPYNIYIEVTAGMF